MLHTDDILGIIVSYDHKQISILIVHVTPWVAILLRSPVDVSPSFQERSMRTTPTGKSHGKHQSFLWVILWVGYWGDNFTVLKTRLEFGVLYTPEV